ncbi:MAG: hypothetical protein LBR22_07180 [Desulfovibrio sp.]|jgi:Fe2+ transport system protein B|nr:hypothetical protein [Desulfovibrio sp.]
MNEVLDRVNDIEKRLDVRDAVQAVLGQVSNEMKDLRESADRAEKAKQANFNDMRKEMRKAVNRAVSRTEKAVQENVKAMRENTKETRSAKRWIIGTIIGTRVALFAIGMTAMYRETSKSWDMAMKAYERSGETNTKVDAQRLAEKWLRKDMQRFVPPPAPTTTPPAPTETPPAVME